MNEIGDAANAVDNSQKTHKKLSKGKIAMIVAGSVLGLILLLVIILAPIIAVGNKVIVKDEEQPNEVLENWMSYVSDDKLIRNLAIPGSHDSGCMEMPWYGATQDLTFAEQLARGTRYFDIRVNASKKGYVIFHGPVNGVSYQGVLDDIAEFMDSHPTEFLILDFSHFKNGSEAKVFEMFEQTVGVDRFIVNDTDNPVAYIDSLTMGDVRGKCLVLIDRDETDFSGKNYFFERTNDKDKFQDAVLTSLYEKSKNGKSAKKFVSEVIPSYIDEFKSINEGLFVLQSQLTDISLIFGPRYREGKLIGLMNEFVKNLYDDDENIKYINIIMRDFVTCEKSALTLRLNLKKGVIADDKAAVFRNGIEEYLA